MESGHKAKGQASPLSGLQVRAYKWVLECEGTYCTVLTGEIGERRSAMYDRLMLQPEHRDNTVVNADAAHSTDKGAICLVKRHCRISPCTVRRGHTVNISGSNRQWAN